MSAKIPYFRLNNTAAEKQAVLRIAESGQWAIGKEIYQAYQTLQNLFKSDKVVLCANGYSALYIAIRCLGIEKQKIIVPCISTCFAMTNAVLATGNIPVFCDMDLNTGNCSKASVEQLVSSQKIQYIISPNHAGILSDTKYFKNELKLTVIEDACQSFLSSIYFNHTTADVTVFSFYPTKGINGIDGGALIIKDQSVYERAKSSVYYSDQVQFESDARFNLRFLNINAAVLNTNLERIDSVKLQLTSIHQQYDAIIQNSSLQYLGMNERSILHRFVISSFKKAQVDLLKDLFDQAEVSFTPFFDWVCDHALVAEFPNAKALVDGTYCIPYFEAMTEQEVNTVCKTLVYANTKI
jgi:perosamine synthetase